MRSVLLLVLLTFNVSLCDRRLRTRNRRSRGSFFIHNPNGNINITPTQGVFINGEGGMVNTGHILINGKMPTNTGHIFIDNVNGDSNFIKAPDYEDYYTKQDEANDKHNNKPKKKEGNAEDNKIDKTGNDEKNYKTDKHEKIDKGPVFKNNETGSKGKGKECKNNKGKGKGNKGKIKSKKGKKNKGKSKKKKKKKEQRDPFENALWLQGFDTGLIGDSEFIKENCWCGRQAAEHYYFMVLDVESMQVIEHGRWGYDKNNNVNFFYNANKYEFGFRQNGNFCQCGERAIEMQLKYSKKKILQGGDKRKKRKKLDFQTNEVRKKYCLMSVNQEYCVGMSSYSDPYNQGTDNDRAVTDSAEHS